jgi:chaperone modulatory protein CbpM
VPIDTAEALDDGGALTLAQLAELSGLPESVVRELVDYGALAPAETQATTWTFSSHCVVIARRAHHLRDDFDLDAHAVSVLLGFVERIERLEAELRALRAQAPGFR